MPWLPGGGVRCAARRRAATSSHQERAVAGAAGVCQTVTIDGRRLAAAPEPAGWVVTMNARIEVSEDAAAALPLLAGCRAAVAASPAAADALAQRADGAVLVLGAAAARAVLAQPPAGDWVILLWLADGAVPPDLREPERIVGVLAPATGADAAHAMIRTALRMLQALAASRSERRFERVLEIGRALAAEKDLDTLLGMILTHARALSGADGASIYTRDRDGRLFFRLWQNASNTGTAEAQRALVGEYSIAGYVARSGEVVNIEDAYRIPASAPYRFNPASDHAIGYRTRSMLTVPLTNKADEVVGVLQLINRKDDPDARLAGPEDVERRVRPFDAQSLELALALAGQAGVALENTHLYAEIERLFEGFIRASVQAIEARDPTTAGHSFRVAAFTERLAVAVDRSGEPDLRALTFSREQLRELRYAALLHDFGKVGVREDVLVKAKKLKPAQLELLEQRFRYARLSVACQAYRQLLDVHQLAPLSAGEFAQRRAELERAVHAEHQRLDEYLHLVLRANEPSVLHADAPAALRELLAYRFPDGAATAPLLHDFEFGDLTVAKGSLSPAERVEIESHVSHTFQFLSLIPWTRDLAALPDIAYAHHEKLDGSGYPRGLTHDAIPVASRIMTIADIYDALTAPDRPYKRAVGPERALDILREEAEREKLDARLLKVFIDAGAWRPVSDADTGRYD